jgi:hypothetical protein
MHPPKRPRIRTSIAAISACLLALASHAHAQSAEAQARFDDGARLMKDGKLDEACAAFETSNRLERRAGTLLRLGECRENNHQLASAWSAYQDALTHATDPRKRTFATNRIKILEPKLSHLTLNVPDAARVAGFQITRDGSPVDPGLWNAAVPVNGGDYTIAATAPGRVAWKTTASVPVEHGQISVAVPELAPAPTTVAPEPAGRPKDMVVLADEPRPASGTFTSRRKLAVGVLGVGVAATVVGVVLGSSASGKRDDAYRLCPDPSAPCAQAPEANSLISTAHTRAYEADAALAVGGAAAVIAGILWFTGAPEHEGVRVDASVGARGGGVAVTGRF